MTVPDSEGFGDWVSEITIRRQPDLYQNYIPFYDSLSGMNLIEKDDTFKQTSLANIQKYPVKYLKNIIANIGRLLFNYPYSRTPQKLTTYFYLLPNMFIFVISILLIFPTIINRKLIPKEIFFLLAFFSISFAGSSLVSSYARQFTVLVPLLATWISTTAALYIPYIKIKAYNYDSSSQ